VYLGLAPVHGTVYSPSFEHMAPPLSRNSNIDTVIIVHQLHCLGLSMQVFMQAFIPRKLNDVVNFERDLDRVRDGIDTDLVRQSVITLR